MMISNHPPQQCMGLFNYGSETEHWGWLCDDESPWRVLSKTSERNLFDIISELAGNESLPSKMVEDADFERGPIFVHEGAEIGTNVRFEGPIYVEEGAEIRHGAYLRPGTYVSRGCVVGHCTELKNTLMLPFSKAPHFNYVGDSILGFKVNLGAGAKISNVRLDRKSIITQLPDGGKVDTNLRKFGALIGDESEIGCNVVTNPGSVIPPNSAIPPNAVVTGLWIN